VAAAAADAGAVVVAAAAAVVADDAPLHLLTAERSFPIGQRFGPMSSLARAKGVATSCAGGHIVRNELRASGFSDSCNRADLVAAGRDETGERATAK
jgi:hypothetical protein